MKKILLALFILLLLALGAIYYLIPGTLVISEAISIHCNRDAAFRKMASDSGWINWNARVRQMGGATFFITKKMNSGFIISINQNKTRLESELSLIPYKKDTTLINWQCSMQASGNPLQRIADYRTAVAIKKSMDSLCKSLQDYLSKFENLYGFQPAEGSTRDTLLIITKSVSPVYPGTGYIYSLIAKLRAFCVQQGCSATGDPMLNITPLGAQQYQVMVALPVNRAMQGIGDVTTGKMVPGKFIITEVRGGMQTVEYTLQQIRNYFQDYGRTSMAIPFSYLVTDRQKEPDTSKWVTRIYAPVY